MVDEVIGVRVQPTQTDGALERLLPKLGRYLENVRSVRRVADVGADDVLAWVDAPLSGGGRPSLATRHNRRTVARQGFRLLREIGAVDHDPTLDMRLPPRTPAREARPLSDKEVQLGRAASLRTLAETRLPSVWALAEATATTQEMPRLLPEHVDLNRGTVMLGGSSKTDAREASLTDWGTRILQLRLRSHSDPRAAVVYQGSGDSSVSMQSSCSRALGRILAEAGLQRDNSVKPGSVRAWAGQRVWQETGRIEEVTRALGCRTLDTAADIIGLHWRAAQ